MPTFQQLHIRPAAKADIDRLASIMCAWKEPDATDKNGYQSELDRWWALHPWHHAILAELGTHAVGMAWLAAVPRLPYPSGGEERMSGDIQSVFVLPEYRGGGIATRLLTETIGLARLLDLTHLTVHSSPMAASLYRQLGFSGELPVFGLDLR
jgi:GNAT superfamily N-acetyltransferase